MLFHSRYSILVIPNLIIAAPIPNGVHRDSRTHVTSKVRRICGIYQLQIPVYRGVDRTLTGSTAESGSYYHGKDGFGEVPDPNAPDFSLIQSEHAVVLSLIHI